MLLNGGRGGHVIHRNNVWNYSEILNTNSQSELSLNFAGFQGHLLGGYSVLLDQSVANLYSSFGMNKLDKFNKNSFEIIFFLLEFWLLLEKINKTKDQVALTLLTKQCTIFFEVMCLFTNHQLYYKFFIILPFWLGLRHNKSGMIASQFYQQLL